MSAQQDWLQRAQQMQQLPPSPDGQPQYAPAQQTWTHEDLVSQRLAWLRADDEARERRAQDQIDEYLSDWQPVTGRAFARLPKPLPVIVDILAAEVNLLGGPTGEGKSLLARDWAMCVATGSPWRETFPCQQRHVVYCFGEGTEDFDVRFEQHPWWDLAADHIWPVTVPVDLTSRAGTDWLISKFEHLKPGLFVFDLIYQMGMQDDNGIRDVQPVLRSMSRISKAFTAATLAVGQPKHADELTGKPPPRRFRGSSAWSQQAYVDWQMGEGKLTCEKSKLTRAKSLEFWYEAAYPVLSFKSDIEVATVRNSREARFTRLIAADFAERPLSTAQARAERLMALPGWGLKDTRTRQLVRAYADELKHKAAAKEDADA